MTTANRPPEHGSSVNPRRSAIAARSPTGFEQAYAKLDLYFLDVAPWMEITFLGEQPPHLATLGDALPQDRTIKGRFGIRWVNPLLDDNAWAEFGVSAAVFVDARPVPRKSLND
jgi:hypothetical protein